MAFDPQRNSAPRRAIRAGRIALARGSHTIELEDWQQAATTPDRPLAPNERDRLKAVSVSDEVIKRVAEDESKRRSKADADPLRHDGRWMRRPVVPKPDE